ncbi:sorting nexin lst-4 [Eurytemora carolleeae]|uniref:sorting nexin lst-4 n=1 Tax=Eurytemora carolleeae TaxID=1294199 RepID=UPI000C78058D|nr:sorting nexin lst-4 [Eurytemora carolleeae]|eukprot:XP_023326992.1 sorting nexin lst-4-like [Eurytemora affinis]
MTYPVTPSFNNVQVSRRYKQFDWLHEQLSAKFGVTIAIPPLPDKQVTGRFEEELIEIRRIELQSFADRICRHPVLSQSAVWKHFISETDEKRWTAGKRKAESDPLVGPGFLTTLQTPEKEGNEDAIALFVPALLKLDSAVKNMYSLTQEQSNRYRSGYKKSIQNLGGGFQGLSASLNGQLPQLEKIGTSFVELGDVFETQAQR